MKTFERIVEKLEATLKYNTTDGSDGSYNTTMMAVTAMVAGRQQGASEHHFLWGEYLQRLLRAAQLHSGSQSCSLISLNTNQYEKDLFFTVFTDRSVKNPEQVWDTDI